VAVHLSTCCLYVKTHSQRLLLPASEDEEGRGPGAMQARGKFNADVKKFLTSEDFEMCIYAMVTIVECGIEECRAAYYLSSLR
jgi:hypothetical protein